MIRTLYSTLYPNSVRPSYGGIFVETRIVAPCRRLKYIHQYV